MTLSIFHIILGIFLIITILLQGKEGGLAKKWGGKNFRSKRGMEKIVFLLTIILAILFILTSILVVLTG